MHAWHRVHACIHSMHAYIARMEWHGEAEPGLGLRIMFAVSDIALMIAMIVDKAFRILTKGGA